MGGGVLGALIKTSCLKSSFRSISNRPVVASIKVTHELLRLASGRVTLDTYTQQLQYRSDGPKAASFDDGFVARVPVLLHEDNVSDNPLGGIKRGWVQIRSFYERLFASPGRYRFEFYDYSLQRHSGVFIAIGQERGQLVTQMARY
jgi:hypothetical protein